MQNIEHINTIDNGKTEDQTFRYAIVIEYLGISFAGSQIQKNQRTVQSELETALNILVKSTIKTVFSGRTDKGVNAKGQVVHFDLPNNVDIRRFQYSLSAILPSDISILSMEQVDKAFHSRKSALTRWYRYIINNRPGRSVWFKEAIHITQKLDVNEMNRSLGYLIGNHDFTSFKNPDSGNPATECHLYKAECSYRDGIIYIDLIANRFLYNMVRIIVGTLINIGKGIFPAEHILEVLNSRDRVKAGPTARAEGLTFMLVKYSDKYNLFKCINKEAINENLFCQAS